MACEEDRPPLPIPVLGRGSRSGPFGEGGRAPSFCIQAHGEPHTLSRAVPRGERATNQGRSWRVGFLQEPGTFGTLGPPRAGRMAGPRGSGRSLRPRKVVGGRVGPARSASGGGGQKQRASAWEREGRLFSQPISAPPHPEILGQCSDVWRALSPAP